MKSPAGWPTFSTRATSTWSTSTAAKTWIGAIRLLCSQLPGGGDEQVQETAADHKGRLSSTSGTRSPAAPRSTSIRAPTWPTSRGGQIDQWPTCKDHIDRTAERVAACHDDLIPGELGWFGINPADGEYDGLQYDEVEYLMCKSLAHDGPISLQTSFARMEQHPLTADILAMIRRYEALRHHQYSRAPITGMKRISARRTSKRLKQAGKDFIIDTDLWDAPLPVETAAVVLPESRTRFASISARPATRR